MHHAHVITGKEKWGVQHIHAGVSINSCGIRSSYRPRKSDERDLDQASAGKA